MEIGVYEVKSSITIYDMKVYDKFFKDIEDEIGCTLKKIDLNEFLASEFRLVFVATGGSEGEFLKMYDKISDKPCYILTTGLSNSLAASMEILSYFKQNNKKGEILHGDPKKVAHRIEALYRATMAKKALNGMKFGLIGAPSDWLIASNADRKAYKEKLGVEVVDITMDELLAEIAKNTYEKSEYTEKLESLGYDKAEVEKALYVYGAFDRLVTKYSLGALTVRCFDLLSSVYTTGCLGLAILNARGIYGGCEGDLPSLMSMAILGEVSGKPVFMCNPSRIEDNSMIFAHCTLPLNMPYEMNLTTHYESGIGVAIAGSIKEDDFTIFKISNDLSRSYIDKGVIVENLREEFLCRTQIRVKFADYSYFTKNPINNHHLVCEGDYTAALNEFCAML